MWTLILILGFIALILLFLIIRKRNAGNFKLEKDPVGLWRYHKETQYEKTEAIVKSQYAKTKKLKCQSTKQTSSDINKCTAVLAFDGDIRASQHKVLATLVDEIEINRDNIEEVVVIVNSTGGMVTQYGHAFAQMERITQLGIPLVVCVDVAAASGGYLMSLPAQKIIAAPFAVIGSVGVIAFVPNIRGFLERFSINPRTFTAGKYKQTVSFTDQANEEEEERFRDQLKAVHRMFLDAVAQYRPQVNMEQIETGDHWTAKESVIKNLGLIDEIGTSSEYLLHINFERDIIKLSSKKSFWDDGLGKLLSYLPEATTHALRR